MRLKYICKVKSGLYRVDLESGYVEINVPRIEGRQFIDQQIKDIVPLRNDDIDDLAKYVRMVLGIDFALSMYNQGAADEWLLREIGGVKQAIQLAVALFLSHHFIAAQTLFIKVDKESVVLTTAFDSEQDYHEWCKNHNDEFEVFERLKSLATFSTTS